MNIETQDATGGKIAQAVSEEPPFCKSTDMAQVIVAAFIEEHHELFGDWLGQLTLP